MKTDLYTKAVLTVIALMLTVIAPVFGQTDRVAELIQQIQDPNAVVRKNAVDLLNKEMMSGDPRVVGPLLAALDDVDSDVRFKAFYPLQLVVILDSPRAVALLLPALKDPRYRVRAGAARALYAVNDEAIQRRLVVPLTITLKDPDASVRLNSARTLWKIDDPRGNRALLGAWKEHDAAVIAGAAPFFVGRGALGSEDVLIEALNNAGDEFTVIAFLNCGNSQLERAASRWAGDHNYVITTSVGRGAPVRWGSRK